MIGGTYLCYEGAEKLWRLSAAARTRTRRADEGARRTRSGVKSAIRTDFILSGEIMVISLDEVADEPLLSRRSS